VHWPTIAKSSAAFGLTWIANRSAEASRQHRRTGRRGRRRRRRIACARGDASRALALFSSNPVFRPAAIAPHTGPARPVRRASVAAVRWRHLGRWGGRLVARRRRVRSGQPGVHCPAGMDPVAASPDRGAFPTVSDDGSRFRRLPRTALHGGW
jgi:hypothetical protein